MAFRSFVGVGFLVERHETHQPHKATDALLVHQVLFIAQMPRHLTHTVKRGFQELLIDQAGRSQVSLQMRGIDH